MKKIFGTDFYGKRKIVSYYDHCDTCHKLAALSSYTTTKFLNLRQFPLIPIGKPARIIDECPYCGHHIITTNRKYRKKRKEDLAAMMECFTAASDSPYAALNGLQTLLVHNEEGWFMDVMESYGQRFDTHVVVQLLIAQGLCHFGHYREAETYCRKAIVLDAGGQAEDLLALCQSQLEKKDAGHVELPSVTAESMLRPYAFVIALVGCLFVALVANSISATRNYTAWLVNGSHLPYFIEIDGSRHRLGQYGLKQIKIRLGEHQMQVHGLAGRKKPIVFNYNTSLIKQRIGNHVLVLNPDASAVMVEETLFEGQTTNRYLFGKVINALEGIDYPFSDFPVWASTKHSAQTRLFTHVPTNNLEMVEFLRVHGKPSDANEYARRTLIIDPSGEEAESLLKISTIDLTMEQAIAFLQRGKAILPPLLTWHCFYQDFMKSRQPGHDLQDEYAALCKTHPDIPECYYLLGRVAQNPVVAKKFFEQYENGVGGSGLGYYAIACDLLYSGQFKAAQPYVKKALEHSPADPEFKKLDQQIYLALRQYDLVLRQIQDDLDTDPDNGELVAKQIKYLTLLGEHKAADEAINSFSGNKKEWSNYLHAVRFYVVGNRSDYLANLSGSGRKDSELQKYLHAGKIEELHDIIGENEDHGYSAHLINYCAAKYHEYPEIAEIELKRAVAEIGQSALVQREVTSFLSSETPPSIKQLLELRIMPAEKAVLCASLGFKFPSQRESFFKLSQKFNYTYEYPHLLLKKWTR